MITFTINDKEFTVDEGTTVLEVAQDANIPIPTLCFHKELSPYGSCRLCLVEIHRRGRVALEPACLYRAEEGIAVKTDTKRVQKTRKVLFELFLARCKDSEALNSLAAEYGVTSTRFSLSEKDECILCGLCVRACAEISQRHAINFYSRGSNREIRTPYNKISETCIGCGACAHVCPMKILKIEEAD